MVEDKGERLRKDRVKESEMSKIDVETPALDRWLEGTHNRWVRLWRVGGDQLWKASAAVGGYHSFAIVVNGFAKPTKAEALATLDEAIASEAGAIMGAS